MNLFLTRANGTTNAVQTLTHVAYRAENGLVSLNSARDEAFMSFKNTDHEQGSNSQRKQTVVVEAKRWRSIKRWRQGLKILIPLRKSDR